MIILKEISHDDFIAKQICNSFISKEIIRQGVFRDIKTQKIFLINFETFKSAGEKFVRKVRRVGRREFYKYLIIPKLINQNLF